MDQEKLFSQLDKRYASKREMLSRIPLGTQAEVVWQQLLNRRRAKSAALPLRNSFGVPYWYCTTEKMISASERIVEMLFENDADTDPYTEVPTLSTLEEVFFTSYVDGSKLQLRDAMDFLQSDRPPQEAEEQLIANNRMAGSYAGQNLFRPVDEQYIRGLAYLLTEGMEGGGQDFRAEDTAVIPSMQDEQFSVPAARMLPDMVREFLVFLIGWKLVGEEPLYGLLFDYEPDSPAPELSEAGHYPVYDVGPDEREMMKERLLAFAETVHGTITP